MNTNDKYRILAKFFANEKTSGDPDLNAIFELMDMWNKEYQKHRSKTSFRIAHIKANEYVLKKYLTTNEQNERAD